MKNLEELILDENRLTVLPDSIGSITKLKILSLGENRIIELPASIKNLINLEALYLGNNPIRKLPAEITTLPALTEFIIDGTLFEQRLPSTELSFEEVFEFIIHDRQE